MKKFTVVFIFSLFTSLISFGQQWEWAKSYGTNNGDQASSLALDPSGNSFITGYYQGTQLVLGATTLNTTFSNNLFVAKHNSGGTVVWAQNIGSNGSLIIGSVCTGTNGNVYVCGTFSGPTLMFGTTTVSLTAGTISNCFIGCFSSSGSTLWVNKYGNSPSPYGVSAKSCYYSPADNSVCMTGTFTGTLTIGSTSLINSTTSNDLFLAKFSIASFSASPTWAIKGGSSTCSDVAQKVRIDKQSNIYIAGSFAPVTGSTTTIGATLTSKGSQDLFIAKYNSAGAWQWSQSYGSTGGSDFLYDMALDTASNIYVTGSYNTNPLLFNTFFGTSTLTAVGGSDAYVAKWASIGLFSSAVKIGSAAGNETGYGLGCDYKGNIYIGGTYSGSTLAIGSTTLTNTAGAINAFVTKLLPSLGFSWSRDSKGSGSAMIWDLDADANDNVYSCGTIQVSAPSSFATTTLTSMGSSDFFVAKISCTTPTITANNSNYSVCMNSVNSFTPTINSPQSDVTYKWSAIGATGVIFSPLTGTTTTITYTGTTSFSVVVTGTNACSNVTTTVGSIVVNSLPNVSASASPTAVCTGSLLTLSGAGANTYSWSNGVTNGAAFTPSASVTYTVTGTDVNSCSNTATINVDIISNPTVSITGNSVACLNSSNILTAIGGTGFSYTWMPGSVTTNTINAQPVSNTVYTVNFTGSNGCNNSEIFFVNILTPPTPDICEVTVDSLSNYNEIYWQKTLYPQADSFFVYREVSAGIYVKIGGRSAADSSMFIDTLRSIGPANGNPNITQYKYKIALRDTCGNLSSPSLWHQTVYVHDNQDGSFNFNLYAIEGATNTPVTNYYLMRRDLSTGFTQSVSATASGTILNDVNYASYSLLNYKWHVEAIGFSCDPTLKINPNGTLAQKVKTKSNQANEFVITKIQEVNFNDLVKVYPNPAKDKFTIEIGRINESLSLELNNVLGQTLYSTNVVERIHVINTINYLSGVYFLNIKLKNKTVAVKKVVIE